MSAFVEGQESEPTPFQEMQVPPSAHRFDQPVLVIEERTGGHVTLMIDKENHRCKVFILTSSFMSLPIGPWQPDGSKLSKGLKLSKKPRG